MDNLQEEREWLENPFTKVFFSYLAERIEALRFVDLDDIYVRGDSETTLSRTAEMLGAVNECIAIHDVSAGEDAFLDVFDPEAT